MAQRDDSVVMLDQEMVPGQCYPAGCGTPLLGQRIAEGGQTTTRSMVGLAVVRGYDSAVDRGQDRASEAGKLLGRLGLYQGAEGDRCGAPGLGDGNEVDGVCRGEQVSAMAGDPVRRTVLDEPATREGIGQIDRSAHAVLSTVSCYRAATVRFGAAALVIVLLLHHRDARALNLRTAIGTQMVMMAMHQANAPRARQPNGSSSKNPCTASTITVIGW